MNVRVCILAVDRLAIDVPDVIRSRLGISCRRSFKRLAGRHVDAERGVVPFHFFRRNVVGAHPSASRTETLLRLRFNRSRRELGQTSDAEKANRPYQAFHGNLLAAPWAATIAETDGGPARAQTSGKCSIRSQTSTRYNRRTIYTSWSSADLWKCNVSE